MPPAIAGGTAPGIPRPTRIQLRPDADPIVLPHLDDSQNLVTGVDYEDRMAIVFAVRHIVERAMPPAGEDPELRRDFLHYVALTMLLKLAHDTQARWGDGPLGSALPPEPRARSPDAGIAHRRLSRRVREARRPERLLLNLVAKDDVLPQFRDLNYPLELRKLQLEDHARTLYKGVFVPSSDLAAEVALHITGLRSATPSPDDVKRLHAMAKGRHPIQVPGIKVAITHMTIPPILAYYGLARPARTERANGYYIVPWRVRQLVGMYSDHRIIRLQDLTWMEGRYLHDGKPLSRGQGPANP